MPCQQLLKIKIKPTFNSADGTLEARDDSILQRDRAQSMLLHDLHHVRDGQ